MKNILENRNCSENRAAWLLVYLVVTHFYYFFIEQFDGFFNGVTLGRPLPFPTAIVVQLNTFAQWNYAYLLPIWPLAAICWYLLVKKRPPEQTIGQEDCPKLQQKAQRQELPQDLNPKP